MAEQKHTAGPGPWSTMYRRAFSLKGNVHVVKDADGFPTAFVPAWDNAGAHEVDGSEEARSNARLITASPDLLAIVRDVEWSAETDMEEGGTEAACPTCDGSRREGHNDGCRLHAALLRVDGPTPIPNTAASPAPDRAGGEECQHDFQGWQEFEDGRGGEQVCTKCGLGAMAWTLRSGA